MTHGDTPKKKGLSTLAWIGIGCGGLVVAGLVVFVVLTFFVVRKGKEMVQEATGAESFEEFVEDMQDNPAKTAAETMVRMNPELELLETDDDAGTITFRNTRTGEKATLDFEDIAEGRFSVTTDEGDYTWDAGEGGEGGVTISGPEGETRFGASTDLGDVPDWVPVYPGAAKTESAFHSTSPTGMMGALSSTTSDDPQKVIDHYKKFFEDRDWEIGGQSMTSAGGGVFAGITGTREGRTVNVGVIRQQGEETQITINYNQETQ